MMPAILRRSLFEPLHGWLTRSPKLGYWRELEKTQFLAEAKLLEMQLSRLLQILHFVWDNNDFYRRRMEQYDLTPWDFRTITDLRKLPILTKTDVRRNGLSMLSRGFTRHSLQQAKTGGSTGKALELYFTEECSEQRNACARRHNCWTGWHPGEPIAACWGNPKIPKNVKEKIKAHLLQPFIFLDTMHVDEPAVRAFVDQWRRVRPTLLYGHAHSLYLLATYLRAMGMEPPRPKGILSTSMMLLPTERRCIEEVFGVKVTDRYGCEEVSLIGSECERHEGMHLNIEHLVIECLRDDGIQAKPGEPGRIVVTDLINRAMPLIRYQVEDVGVLTDRKCSCGRGLPLMEQVTGRVADFLIKADGSKVAGVSLIENTLTDLPGLDQMQIVQEEIRCILLRIVPGDGYQEEVREALVTYFHGIFGEQVTVKIDVVDKILPEPSGKYRFSICNVRQ